MHEYTIIYKDGLAAGLRPSEHNPRNQGALVQADGVIQESKEIFNLDELPTFDTSVLGPCTFPFPQIFQLREWTVVCTPIRVYTYDGLSLILAYTALEGSTWTFADFHNYIIMTNGRELITLDPKTGVWSKYMDSAIPECLCICDLNGQVFVGGPNVSVSAGFLGE